MRWENSLLVLLRIPAQIPRLHNPLLRPIHLLFGLDVLDPDFQAILSEDDILLVHAFRSHIADLSRADVDLVENKSDASEEEEEEDEGGELATVEKARSVSRRRFYFIPTAVAPGSGRGVLLLRGYDKTAIETEANATRQYGASLARYRRVMCRKGTQRSVPGEPASPPETWRAGAGKDGEETYLVVDALVIVSNP